MEEKEGKKKEEAPAASEAIDKVKSTYQSLDELLEVKEGDRWPVVLLKVGARLLAIGLLILLSPFILLVLLIAFTAAL